MGLFILGLLLFVVSFFMMLLILVQKGKGGGLTGALGGMGGQSAFGSKAGDVFTKVTVITAIIWIVLCMLTIQLYNPPPRPQPSQADSGTSTMTSGEGDAEEAKDNKAMEQIIKDQKALKDEAAGADEAKLKQEIQKDQAEIEGKTDSTAGPDLNAPETAPETAPKTNAPQENKAGGSETSSDKDSSNDKG